MRDAPPPKLAKHSVVAALIGVATSQVSRWIREGHFPAPHATIGRTHFYRVEDVERFVKTGSWFKAD